MQDSLWPFPRELDNDVENLLEGFRAFRHAKIKDAEPGVVSVVVEERHQSDTSLLCGARTLFLDSATGNIWLRGINKFPDLHDAPPGQVQRALAGAKCGYLLRKMAGFVVHVWSPDGVSLRVASKHALEGPHVTAAQAYLDGLVRREALAKWLHEGGLVLSGECVDSVFDAYHPILDAAFDRQVVFFAAHCRRSRLELTLPFAELVRCGAMFDLAVTPWRGLHGEAGILTQAEALVVDGWHETARGAELDAACRGAGAMFPLAEGFVVLLELPVSGSADAYVLPLRYKMKTLKYTVRRSIRGALEGSSQAPEWIRRSDYAALFRTWATATNGSMEGTADVVRARGVSLVVDAFEAATDPEVLAAAIRQLAERAAVAQRTTHHVVLLCGLPGSGKSTWAQAVASETGAEVLSRDHELASIGSDRRGAARSAHGKILGKLHRALSALGSRVIILDAVHATEAARRFWLRAVPPNHRATVVFFPESNLTALATRLSKRTSHETLSSHEVEAALFTIARLFTRPTTDELARSRSETALTTPSDELIRELKRVAPADLPSLAGEDHLWRIVPRKASVRSVSLRSAHPVDLRAAAFKYVVELLRDACASHQQVASGSAAWIEPFFAQGGCSLEEGVRRLFDTDKTEPVAWMDPTSLDVETLAESDGSRVDIALGDILLDRNVLCVECTTQGLGTVAMLVIGLRRGAEPLQAFKLAAELAGETSEAASKRSRGEKRAPAVSRARISGNPARASHTFATFLAIERG
jgi:predicted kinase